MLLPLLAGPTIRPPAPPPDPVISQLDHVEVELGRESAEVVAYDSDDAVIGVIATWIDDKGNIWITSEYDDGVGDLVIVDSTVLEEFSLPRVTLERRAEAIGALVDELAGPDRAQGKSWWKCGQYAAVAAYGCYTARPVACVVGAIKTACECVPKLVKEFKHISCPGPA